MSLQKLSSAVMRRAVLVMVLGLACAHADPRGDVSRDRAAVVAVLQAQQDAWNRGDLEGFLRGYDPGPDLVFTAGGQIQRGFADTRARYQARYGADGTRSMGQLGFEILDVRLLGADGAIVLGRWRLSFPAARPIADPAAAGATPGSAEGVFSLALLRTPAGWRIVHDHTSAAAP